MAADKITAANSGVRGHVSIWRVDEKTGLQTPVGNQPNQIQYTWGFLAANCFGRRRGADRPDYSISALYIEYENQTDPEQPVSVASSFSRNLGIAYYNDLVNSTNRDFLRIPLTIEPTIGVSSGFEANLPVEQQGNKLTFFVQTAGVTGTLGRPFSHTVNSKVFAAALVAAPVFGDRTKDVVFARTVFNVDNQVTKEASSQIGITWDIAFE
ncbi:hypothetical protein EBZ39_00210 [bacterium]|nr:hypothetical protein [bacterium]